MNATTSISLAKALKLKNRLAGRIAKLTDDIKTYNSYQEGTESVDVPALLTERATVVRQLIDLKVAIAKANTAIQRAIFELAERKADIALLSGLATKHGLYKEGYPQAGEVAYIAQIRKAEVDQRVLELQLEIDRLQDQLDSFNHVTKIEVDAALTTVD